MCDKQKEKAQTNQKPKKHNTTDRNLEKVTLLQQINTQNGLGRTSEYHLVQLLC